MAEARETGKLYKFEIRTPKQTFIYHAIIFTYKFARTRGPEDWYKRPPPFDPATIKDEIVTRFGWAVWKDGWTPGDFECLWLDTADQAFVVIHSAIAGQTGPGDVTCYLEDA